jgi:ATP-dependent DNA helicase RecQ
MNGEQTALFTVGSEVQQSWSKLIKTRDGWRCANADKYPELDHTLFELNAHHLKPKKFGGSNQSLNGITYCRGCHAAEHPEFQQKFMDVYTLQWIHLKDKVKAWLAIPSELKYYRLLQFITGQLTFRPLQKEIIKAIVEDKKHVLAVLPTGTGKSILYQIPGLLNQHHPSLVFSPLKALQTDQVTNLANAWIPATYINSSLAKDEVKARIDGIKQGIFPFVFIHPKQLLRYDQENRDIWVKSEKPLVSAQFDYLVVDEVHVIKSQGLSFVKEYYHLDKIYQMYQQPQMILLTATASKQTRDFIIDQLGLNRSDVAEFVSGFYRPEIELEVHETNCADADTGEFMSHDDSLVALLEEHDDVKTIVFATTIKQVEAVYELLDTKGYAVSQFHGRMSDEQKELHFKRFTDKIPSEKTNIMVATSAFGMGINIPNIRQVIHYSMPFSISDYYQQFGRAARDGQPAVAKLLYNSREAFSLTDFINQKTLEKETDAEVRGLLQKQFNEEKEALKGFVMARNKWQYILDYFGEKPDYLGKNRAINQGNKYLLYLILIFVALLLWLMVLIKNQEML